MTTLTYSVCIPGVGIYSGPHDTITAARADLRGAPATAIIVCDQADAAQQEGYQAGLRGEDWRTSCPYTDGPERDVWLSGHTHGAVERVG